MNAIWIMLQSTTVELIVLTLLNSLWQGVLWVLLLMLVLRTLPARQTNLRYALAVSSLFGIVITVLVTWSLLNGSWREASAADQVTLTTSVVESGGTEGTESVESELVGTGSMMVAEPSTMSDLMHVASDSTDRAHSWVAMCAVTWACGCLLMLVRGLRSIAAARGLLRGETCESVEILNVLARTRSRLGLQRPVRIVMTETLNMPAVWGVWKPVLLLPASLASNLSIAELEAVFAHELAHVRRYDHVVNLVQLLVEAILFFNPTVWWISRQIRLEREACCDAAAASLTRNPIGYAELLAANASPQSGARAVPATVLALSGGSDGSLLDRVRRVLSPAHRPEMRLSWRTCLLLIAVSGGVLYALHRGTTVAVQVAADIMTDDERVETIAEQARQVDPGMTEEREFNQIRIRGRVVIAPSLATVDEVSINSLVRQENNSKFSSEGAVSDEFDVRVDAGRVWLFFNHRDAAVSVLGPFGPQDGTDITDQVVIIAPGEDVTVRVLDDTNQPAEGVTVSASAVVHGNGFVSDQGVTDDEGIVTFRNVSVNMDYSLSLSGAGYQQTDPPDGPLNPQAMATYSISRAVPARGVIIDEQGQPIAGVQIRDYLKRREGHSHSSGGFDDPIAMTDGDGAFVLDALEDGWRYHLVLRHPRFADTILANVQPGDEDLRGTMVSGISVTGIVNGVEQMSPDDRELSWGEVALLPIGDGGALVRRTVYRRGKTAIDEEGRFTLQHVPPGTLEIRLGSQTRTFEVSADSADIAIDFESTPTQQTRQLVIRFEHEGRPAKPEGRLRLNGLSSRIGSTVTSSTDARIVDGQARVDVPVPMTRPVLHADPDGLIGFWFNSHDVEWPTIEAAEEPYELVIPVLPAGAIEGQIVTKEGLPAVEVGVGATINFEYPRSASGGVRTYGGGMNTKTDAEGRFFLTPLPLEASCVMTLSDGFYRQVGEEIVLDGAAPVQSVELQLGERVTVSGQLLDPNGVPIHGMSAELYFNHPRGGMSWSPPVATDAEGRFQFAGLNADADGQYEVDLAFHADYVPQRVPLRLGEANVIRLKTGRVLTGRTLDEQGQPVPGVEVYAMRADLDLSPGAINSYEAEAVTDPEGRFRFSNLPDLRLRINSRQLQNEEEVSIEPGESGEITLRGRVAEWHRARLENSGE